MNAFCYIYKILHLPNNKSPKFQLKMDSKISSNNKRAIGAPKATSHPGRPKGPNKSSDVEKGKNWKMRDNTTLICPWWTKKKLKEGQLYT